MRPLSHRLPAAYTLWSRLARLWERLAELTRRATRPARTRLEVTPLEDRTVPSRPYPFPVLFVGSGVGDAPVVKAYDADTGAFDYQQTVYESTFTGGVRVTAGDITHDGYPDLIVAPGPGGGPRIHVLDGKTGEQISGPLGSFWAFEESFTGGVEVTSADVNGDGIADIIAAAGAGGGPRVKVFSGADGSVLSDFYAFEADFTGGVSVAAADFNGDGKAELVIGAGPGGGPRVRVYDPLTGEPSSGPLADFFAFDESFRGGVAVGTDALAGDVNGDGTPDVVVGAGPGMGSEVKVFSGATGTLARDFSPFGSGMTAGVRVATAFADDDRYADIVVGTGQGASGEVRVFSGLTGDQLSGAAGSYVPFGGSLGGLFVAASNDPLTPGIGVGADPSSVVAGQTVLLTTVLTGTTFHGVPLIPSGTMSYTATDTSTSATYTLGTAAVATTDAVNLLAGGNLATGSLPAGSYTITGTYSGDSNFLSTSSTASLTVSAASSTAPPKFPPMLDGSPVLGGSPVPAADASWPGAVVVDQADLSSAGFGTPWSQDWTWTNLPGYADGLVGDGASQAQAPHLMQLNGDDSVAVIPGPGSSHFFDRYGGAYHPVFTTAGALTHDTTNHLFVETDPAGSVLTYYDFSTGTPSGRAGRLISVADPAGNLTSVTSWDTGGGPAEVQRVNGTGSTAQTESYLYTYVASGDDAGLLASVTRRRRVGTGSWATVGSVEYAYYTSSDAHGTPHHLKTATVKDAGGNVTDTSYYRWFTSGMSNGLMSYAFGPAAYARLTAALGTGVDALSDTQVAPYADRAFTYDSSKRVTSETDAGAGNSGGLGTSSYSYTTNSGASALSVPNEWKVKTVQTRPDGSTVTTYKNAFGLVMLSVETDTAASLSRDRYNRYDDLERVVLTADPSAVSGYSESNADLVGYSGGNATYLRDSDGLLTAYTYASSTTATSSAAGDVAGYLKEVDLLHGETGTAVPQQSRAYVERTAGGVDLFFPASSTVYRNADGTGGQTTSTSYTWQGTTAQPASVTVTLPTVTTTQNGPGTATSAVTVLDTYGRPEWQKDPGGFLTYTSHDPVTGAVTKRIADVDTTQTSDFADLPSGWSTPSGGGLHLITTSEVDGQGRATKVTDPNGRVDYTVYDDPDHEVRSYPGWNTTTNAPTGPTVVTREDRTGNYTETLTMSAAPAVSSGRPTGAESIGNLQSLSRAYRNDAGQVVSSDVYFDLSGLTYSTSTSLGTAGTNFYRTVSGYDAGGRPDRAVSPEGTVYRAVYTGFGQVGSEWVGTDDTPTSGSWSPTNTAGTDLVKVREYEYDSGGVGDGNRTKATEHPGLSESDRVTQTFYDWRDRAVAVKAGVETSESTSVNRPITYTDYDNLGEVTKTRVYDGDGVSITSTGGGPNAPSSSLLRAQTTTSFDELGRVYRADTYSVDPSSGSVGAYTLHTDTWYDARGNVIKTLAPGGLVTKTAYDGVGRPTTVSTADGGGDSSYSDAGSVTGDAVLEQREITYDGNGDVLATVTRLRFHDETGTGALGTPSSGAHARVSYTGAYYDKADRLTASVDVGTNGGTAWTRPSSIPSRSDTVLVTSTIYAADAVQTVRLTGSPTGGTFTLTFGGQTTAGIAYNASASTVQSALTGLSSVGSGNVVVTAASGGGWQVRFAGTLAGAWQARMTTSGSGLTGGSSPGVSVATVSAGGDAGRVAAVTDPAGLVSRTYSDALGRAMQTVEDFTDGAITDTSNKTTEYTYNSVGRTSLRADLTGGGGQTTAWVYGVTQSGSGFTSNDVVGTTDYPDPSTGAASSSQQESVTINALDQMVTSADRNGSVHTLTFDALGRVVSDAVTTLGSGVDGSVRRIETAYDGQGNASLVTSYDAASGGSVVNQVQRAYNGLGQMITEWQEHGGAVNTSTSPKVQSAYSEMPSGADHSRLTSITYPSGYVLTYDYSSGLNDSISRLSSLSDSTGTLEGYSYLGLSTVVTRSHPQPGVDLTYVKQGSESNGDAGDQYTGLDRFGRVVDQRWIKTSTGTATDWFQYGYDRDSNALYRDNLVNGAFGELFSYDGLNQIASFARGTLNGTKTGISGTASRTQSWDYDALGNWDSVTTNGTAQTRSANKQNEVTGVSGATTPTYDANGNMTGDETGKTLIYDAWNRLAAVKSDSTTLETFAYDGLGRRVRNTVGSTTTDLYYSDKRQVLEEKVGSSTTARYVWSPVYVDGMILRDRDTDGNGTLDERLWVQQDANWNVTALVNGSGSVVERYAYDPFGAVTVYDASYSVRSGGSACTWVYSFQGMRSDTVSGLDEANNRRYSPALGIWTSLDPIRYKGGDNRLYGFVGNDPVTRTDPSGLFNLAAFWQGASAGGESGLTPGIIAGVVTGLLFTARSTAGMQSPETLAVGGTIGGLIGGAIGYGAGYVSGGINAVISHPPGAVNPGQATEAGSIGGYLGIGVLYCPPLAGPVAIYEVVQFFSNL
jgi:RHS repeat-associated protein